MLKYTSVFLFSFFCLIINAQTELAITEKVRQTAISSTGFQLSQKTNQPSRMTIKYGLTPLMTNTYESETLSTSHLISIDDLEPSTFYHVQLITKTEEETIVGEPQIMATASESSGEIRYYFLNGVDESYSNGLVPDGDEYPELLEAMYDLIDNAQNTIDCAIYNTSWYELVDRLEDAAERGVRVRYIHDNDTNNNALQGNIGFPLLVGSPDNGIMHNKFMIVDADSEQDSYVLTGAMNWSYNNITEDHNNTVIIQDKTLALNYTIEFEEMWGSNGAEPDAGNAKFGDQKTDNTAHFFNIGGTEIECYFSPSDGVSDKIEEVLDSADESVEVALLLMTRQQLATKMKDKFFQGVNVRGMFDIYDTDEFEFLESQNVNVLYHWPDIMLHHKYAIVDANFPDSAPTVVTGSHNWTNSAETINDENTLIFRDADVANLFLQEFEARWAEVAPVSSQSNISSPFSDTYVFPNPVETKLSLQLSAKQVETVTVRIVNTVGQLQYLSSRELIVGDNLLNISFAEMPTGVYFLYLMNEKGEGLFTQKVVKN